MTLKKTLEELNNEAVKIIADLQSITGTGQYTKKLGALAKDLQNEFNTLNIKTDLNKQDIAFYMFFAKETISEAHKIVNKDTSMTDFLLHHDKVPLALTIEDRITDFQNACSNILESLHKSSLSPSMARDTADTTPDHSSRRYKP